MAARILASLSVCHLLNDMMQSLLPSIYPILRQHFGLSFSQIGVITLVNQITASLLQPVIGSYTDRRPQPYSLAIGMAFTLSGMVLLAFGVTFGLIVLAAALIGLGSAVFHPESSRIARLASGGRHGFAQAFFQVGGNAGSALGPLLAAFFVLPYGQRHLAWFSLTALLGIVLLTNVGHWYKHHRVTIARHHAEPATSGAPLPWNTIVALALLLGLLFSKYVYLASFGSYYTFYLIDRFQLSVQDAQLHLFLFLGAVAAGTMIGGPIGDRMGRRRVILWSILGVLPFSLALPYVDLLWTRILSMVIGLILASAFSAIIVYAQELVPGRVGTVSGLFFGFAFGFAGIGAAVLGKMADRTSIALVFKVCSCLPAIGMLGFWLPSIEPHRK
ncbi:MAG TPA: MFS transporter [Vicinamibacterales bacterium]|nr:MFS transporter [Vicinamibacterales bacterium]